MNKEKTLLTIITEAVLEDDVIKHLKDLGAHGYTVFDARGKGGQELLAGDRVEVPNIQIQVICNADVADAVQSAFQDKYFENYAMVIYRSVVEVIRSDKF